MPRINDGDQAAQDSNAKDGAFGVDVTTGAGVTVVPANNDRIELLVMNVSDTDMMIGLGETPIATAGSETGVKLRPNGSLLLDTWLGDVRAAHLSASSKRIVGAEV